MATWQRNQSGVEPMANIFHFQIPIPIPAYGTRLISPGHRNFRLKMKMFIKKFSLLHKFPERQRLRQAPQQQQQVAAGAI